MCANDNAGGNGPSHLPYRIVYHSLGCDPFGFGNKTRKERKLHMKRRLIQAGASESICVCVDLQIRLDAMNAGVSGLSFFMLAAVYAYMVTRTHILTYK